MQAPDRVKWMVPGPLVIQATLVLKKNIKSFFDPWQIFQTITDVIVAIPIYNTMILAQFYC